jgi:hypothetical protein
LRIEAEEVESLEYFIQNRLVVDEVGYCFWMRLNADCGERLDAVCGGWHFYSHDPELGGSAWIELQK